MVFVFMVFVLLKFHALSMHIFLHVYSFGGFVYM